MLIPLLLISLMLSAWVTLGIWGYSPYSRFLSHEGLRPADFGSVGSVLIIITGWLIMIVAMMLPTSLPLLDMFARMTQRRSDHAVLVCLLIVGYLFVWVLFGIVAVFVDSLLHEAVDQWRWIANHDWFIGASLFGVAGLSIYPSEVLLPRQMSIAHEFFDGPLAGAPRSLSCFSVGLATRPVLSGLLLVVDAADVCYRHE